MGNEGRSEPIGSPERCAAFRFRSVRLCCRFHRQMFDRSQNKRAEKLLFSVLLRWGTKRSEKGSEKVERHKPSVDWSTESLPPCARGIKTNKHSNRKVFLDNGENVVTFVFSRQSLPWMKQEADVLHSCPLFNASRSYDRFS